MKHIYITVMIVTCLTILSCGKQLEKYPSMSTAIQRGLEPTIIKFSKKEQEYISLFAKKLAQRGYPLDQITRVDLKKSIETTGQFYSYNEVNFYINPTVHYAGDIHQTMLNIGLSWDDPAVIYHEDGSMEFELGRKVNPVDLIPFFYRLDDSYENSALMENYDEIINKVDSVFLSSKEETTDSSDRLAIHNSVADITSKGIFELLHNYHIEIRVNKEKKNIFEVFITRFEWKNVNEEHYHGTQDNIHLEVDYESISIKVIDRYDPYFFPSPAMPPEDFFPNDR